MWTMKSSEVTAPSCFGYALGQILRDTTGSCALLRRAAQIRD
jgi:hypothetical protein